MHVHAQNPVELSGTGMHALSGSDQHAAIASSITTSIAISCLELSGWRSIQCTMDRQPDPTNASFLLAPTWFLYGPKCMVSVWSPNAWSTPGMVSV